jgi:hypothetical protein
MKLAGVMSSIVIRLAEESLSSYGWSDAAQRPRASRSTPSLRGAAAWRLGQPPTHSRTSPQARHLRLSGRPPGQPKVLVSFQGCSEVFGGHLGGESSGLGFTSAELQ